MRILFVVNEHSRRGDSSLAPVLQVLETAGHSVVVERVPKSRQSVDVIRGRDADTDAIVLGGGDGTPHSAAPALLEAGLPVGIIPLGTCNDLARSLGIPLDPLKAAGIIAAGKLRPVDLGEVNGVPFFNVAHIGIGAALKVRKKMKRRFGPLAYAMAGLSLMRSFRVFRAAIGIDGRTEKLVALNITVGNGRFFGGSGMVSEDARIDDGFLHLFSVDTKNPIRLAALVPSIRRGRQARSSKVQAWTSPSFRIDTRKPMPIRADGKVITETPANFRIRPGALRFFAP